jgi:hypothetical protein
MVTAVGAALAHGADDSPGAGPDGMTERVLRESQESFPNPERGFYAPRTTNRLGRLDDLRKQGISLLLVEMNLREFKDRDLTPEKLAELDQTFAAARRNGLKIIFRAAYGFTNRDYRTDPKDMARILGHIRQLGSVMTRERDVLCGVQAGFLGPWGEWHGSNWGDPPSLAARRQVLFALLDAVPAPITVHERRPMFIRDIFADQPGGLDLTEQTAFGASGLARTGWHDDAFLALPDDMGTYTERGWNRQRELAWCSRHGRFTPFGGETVGSAARTPVDQAIREMELLHASYLNIAYHPRVLRLWKETMYQGETAFRQIERRLGYRFVAQRISYPRELAAGGTCRFELVLKNVGFASPHLPRDVRVALLRKGETKPATTRALTDADPRRWGPEAGLVTVRGEVPVPAEGARGQWQLVLALADPSERLRDDGRYAIRLANEDVAFSERDGWNILVNDITVR